MAEVSKKKLKMKQLADELFGMFERGQFVEAGVLFDKNAVIATRYGANDEMNYEDFVKTATDGPLSKLGWPVYLQRVVSPISVDNGISTSQELGFVEQHVTRLSIGGEAVEFPVCIVCKCDSDTGLITSLEEYLDVGNITAALKKGSRISKVSAKGMDPENQLFVQPKQKLVVIITGATSGIGESIAYVYAKSAGRIALAGRRSHRLEQVARKCKELNSESEILIVTTDVSKREECKALVNKTFETFGKIDRLILNAGISQSVPVSEAPEKLTSDLMNVNFFGAIETTQAALPYLRDNDSKIAVVSSALGKLVAPNQASYVASKWALHGYFGSLRLELLPRGVSVSIICPGPVSTEILGNLIGPDGNRVGFNIGEDEKKQMMSPDHAANLVITCTENSIREYVFGKDLQELTKLAAVNPQQAEQITSALYSKLHKERQTFSKL